MAFAAIGPVSTKSLWTLDPRTLPGCVLWLDANDSNTLVLSGSNVTTWNDKSEYGFHMDASADAGSVTYSSNAFNGLPAIQFANNGRLCNAMQQYLFNSNVTAAVVFQKTGLDGTLDTVIGRYFGSTPIFGGDTSSGNVRIIGNGTTTRTFDASGAFSLRTIQPNIFVFQTGSDLSWNEFWNGIQQPIGGATDVGTVAYSDASSGNVLTIGGFGTTPARTFNGLVSEVILFNTRLDRFERQSLEGYLANKWNMVYALPSNHPYGTAFLRNIITSPSAIPTCSAWFDAADSSRFVLGTTGIDVSAWLDKVSNFHLIGPGTLSNPSYNRIEKHVGFSFDLSTHLTISGGADLVINGPYTVFAVEQRTSTNIGQGGTINPIMGGTSASASSNFNVGYTNSTTMRHAIQGLAVTTTVPGFDSNFERNKVWTFGYTGTARTIYSNGTLAATSNTTQNVLAWPGAAIGRFFGAGTPSNNFYNGKIKELIFYRSSLIDASREQVENYLAYKWGLFSNSEALSEFRSTNPAFFRLTTPLDISGCVGWYDANDATTITLSGTTDVSGWRNKAQLNVQNMSNYGTRFPKYAIDPSSGFFTVRFDASTQFISTDISTSTVRNTYFAVARVNSITSNAANSGIQMLFGLRDSYGGDASVRSTSIDPYWDTSFNVTSNMLWAPENNGSLYANGVGPLAIAGRSAAINNLNILTVLSDVSLTSRFTISSSNATRGLTDAYIYELIRYNRTLTSNERQRVEGYLAYKWGLTSNLTANSPYSLYYGNKFLPTDISSCSAWYDAADSTTITLSGATTQILRWRDKTGNGFDLSLGATDNTPIYLSNQHVSFNGTNTGLFITNGSGLVVNQSFTVVVLEQRATGAGSNYFMGGSGTGTNSNLHFGYFNNASVRLGFWNNDLNVSVGVFDTSAQRFAAWTALYGGGVRQIYINNSLIATQNTAQNLLDWNNSYIGRFPQGTNFYNGRMREILFFRSALTSNELSNVHSYLAWKWNLQSIIPITSTISNIVPPNYSSFLPLDISGLSIWLDGADPAGNGVVPADGETVSRWFDKSENNRSVIATIAAPTYSSNFRAINFNGSDQRYNSTNLPGQISSATMFSVMRQTSGTGSMVGNTGILSWRTEGSRVFSMVKAGTAGTVSSTVGVSCDLVSTYLFDSYFVSNVAGSNLIAIDGSQYPLSANITYTTFSNVNYNIGSPGYGGQIMELLMYQNRILTIEERLKVQGYLAHKWGINGKLPDNHPYKKFRV
jgi:hypothetical protein